MSKMCYYKIEQETWVFQKKELLRFTNQILISYLIIFEWYLTFQSFVLVFSRGNFNLFIIIKFAGSESTIKQIKNITFLFKKKSHYNYKNKRDYLSANSYEISLTDCTKYLPSTPMVLTTHFKYAASPIPTQTYQHRMCSLVKGCSMNLNFSCRPVRCECSA